MKSLHCQNWNCSTFLCANYSYCQTFSHSAFNLWKYKNTWLNIKIFYMKKEIFLSDVLHSGLSEKKKKKSDLKEIKRYFNWIYFSLLSWRISTVLKGLFKLYKCLGICLDHGCWKWTMLSVCPGHGSYTACIFMYERVTNCFLLFFF